MSMKELGHELHIVTPVVPTSCANAAAFNTAFTTTNMDTQGYESCMFILTIGHDSATPDYHFQMFETDVSVTDAGTAVAATDFIVHGRDNLTGLVNDTYTTATQVDTGGADAAEHVTYVFEYLGDQRWVRLQCPTGTTTNHFSCVCIRGHGRRMPTVV